MLFKDVFDEYTFKHMIDNLPAEADNMFFDHFHSGYELLLCVSGMGRISINERQYSLLPGSLMFIRPGTHHCTTPDDGLQYERYVINFSRFAVPVSLLNKLDECGEVYNADGTPLPSLFSRFDAHWASFSSTDAVRELLKCTLTEILVNLCYYMTDAIPAEAPDKNLTLIFSFIEQNLTRIDTIADIARGVHMSSSSVRNAFFNYTRVPIMRYIRGKKCILADSMLRSGSHPTEIYYKCGFKTYSTFYRCYTKLFSHPPSAEHISG